MGENAYLGVIMNFMFDETKLPMRFDDGFHSFSTLAAHSQVPLASMSMFQGGDGEEGWSVESGLAGQATLLQREEDPPMDEDIIIPPQGAPACQRPLHVDCPEGL